MPLSEEGNQIPATKEGLPQRSRLERDVIVWPVSSSQKYS